MAENIFETRTVTMSTDSTVAAQNLSILAVSVWSRSGACGHSWTL